MDLLLDMGNTRLKWAVCDRDGMRGGDPVVHAHAAWTQELVVAWAGLQPHAVWLAAVANPHETRALRAACSVAFPQAGLHELTSPREAAGVRNAYAVPERLGVDRFMALLGARARTADAALVVGCGTAIAIDALAADGEHLGGLILPSARTMQDAVLAATARVERREAGCLLPPGEFGRSTEDGLVSGSWRAIAAAVADARATLAARLQQPVRTFLHGGDAAQLAALLPGAAECTPALVLEGLARYAQSRR